MFFFISALKFQVLDMSDSGCLEAINIVRWNLVLLSNVEDLFVELAPVVVVDAGEHVVHALLVQSARQDLDEIVVCAETQAGLNLVAEPVPIDVSGTFDQVGLGVQTHQVAHLRHKHKAPAEDAGRH
eukprot:CAMPEP_0116958322 /NCGR_PEP_ID=MMETSP0467-20121206/44562_1 /TAXON_ID=283647 /ORGANISM="Mesodinium pulex, Strain SPMC105" /LENGTH=126 /DNA_ID=CAMNT_0004645369 /DNA_START=336 /DNA_END=716 /DNA_ORIENTATION=+